jgi:hypothetical protein
MKHYLSPQGQIFAYESDGSQDHLIPSGFTPITENQTDSLREQMIQNSFDSLPYEQKRKIEYPSVIEQLDTLYHGGYDVWKSSIKAIKDKYPKS